MEVSRSLVVRFSQDMAELYTDLLGLGEAMQSGALFTTAQRLVETLKLEDTLEETNTPHAQAAPSRQTQRCVLQPQDEGRHAGGPIGLSVAGVAEVLALSVLARLTELDRQGMLPRPGRRRRLFGLTLSLLKAIRQQHALPAPARRPAGFEEAS